VTVVAEDEKGQFKRLVRDLMDAIRNGTDPLTREFGDVRVVLSVTSQTDAYIDVALTLTRKPG